MKALVTILPSAAKMVSGITQSKREEGGEGGAPAGYGTRTEWDERGSPMCQSRAPTTGPPSSQY